MAAAKVAKIAERQAADGVSAPAGVCLPFSTLEWALRDAGGAAYDHYYDLLAVLETADDATTRQVRSRNWATGHARDSRRERRRESKE